MEPLDTPPETTAPVDTGVALSTPTPAVDPDTQVSLGGGIAQNLAVPQPIAEERAKKIQEGVGEHLQKSTQDIQTELQQGREDQLRHQAAAALNEQKAKQQQQMIINLANQKSGPLDENEANRILDPFNPANKPVDPNSVVESAYGTKFVASIEDAIKANPGNPVEQAKQEIPDQVDDAYLKGSELMAKMEGFKKIREDLETRIHGQDWTGYAADQFKQMWQPYNEYKLRGLVPEVGKFSGGILLGNNLEAQGDRVFSLPIDQGLKVAKEVTNELAKDNLTLAHRWISYVEGLSNTDRILDNTFSLIAPFDYAAIGKAGVGLARKVSLYNRTNIAVRQLVEAGDKIGTDAAARAEAAGDTGTAATNKASNIILQNISGHGDPVTVATNDTLLTNLNLDKGKIAAAPGNLTTPQVTRILDQYDASGKTLVQRILDAARINRIPMALATQNAVSVIKDAVRDYYPGIRNAILDISNPLYEPKSNTYWHEITFGNFGGKLFSNPETAQNFAKLHGIDADIIESAGTITTPKVEAMLQDKAALEANITDWEQTVIRRKAEAADVKRTPQERAYSKDQAEGITQQIKIGHQKVDDIALRLKGKETYDRVQKLQNDISFHDASNKELRAAAKGRKDLTDEDKAVIEGQSTFHKEQIKAKSQEINAIRENRASVIGPKDTIEQHGVGFKLVVRRPLVETDSAVRDLMIRDVNKKLIPQATSSASQDGFKSILNSALGKFRGADDTLALNESIQRKIGTYSQSLFKEWAQQEAKYIKQLASGVIRTDPVTGQDIPYWRAKPTALYNKFTGQTKQTYNEFVRTLDHARDEHDPDTGKPGYFYQTPAELENWYRSNFHRPPSFAEHEAYFAFVRMVEGDRIMREVSEFRNRARLGVEQHQLFARGPDGKKVSSGFFDGRVRKVFPGGDDVLMITGKRLGDEKLVNLGGAGITPKKLEEYKEAVRLGKMKVIEVYAPEYTPLRSYSDVAGNEVVRYVLTDSAESKPIEFNHVNRRGGGHFEYDYDHFIKQPKMYHQWETGTKGRYKSTYLGDTTFMPILNKAMGRDIVNKLHTIQAFIRSGDIESAKAFTEKHLPIEFDDLHGMFKPGRDATGKITRPQLDLNENFSVVSKNRSVLDTDEGRVLEEKYGKLFKDATKSGSLNRQFQVAFNTERESAGLRHLEDVGTAGNPLYKYAAEDKMVDPLTTMNRSLNRIVNSVFMDDYKMYAVEHWLREAENLLKAKFTDIRAAPFWHFENSQDKSAFRSDVSPQAVNNLLSNRYKIKQFVGVPSTFDNQLDAAVSKLSDMAYTAFGPEAGRSIPAKIVTVLPLHALANIKDPVTYIRSLTFHAKLGLFNPAQLLVQAQTFATIWALSPKNAALATLGTLLHQWYRINPTHLPTLDRLASKMGWRPGEFSESINLLSHTGFDKVAGEYANLNTALKTDFFMGEARAFIRGGTFFFSEGEKSTRMGAWHTAYKDFRDAHPTGPISKDDLGLILHNADLLTANMSRASNSAMQSGAFSLTTQFMTYQFRTAELMLGSRITGMQKFRMALFYSLLYGAPSAIGLSGAPLTTSIRQEAIERGYQVGDNWLTTAIDQGLPAMFGAWITGGGDWRKGNNYNIGDRYGSPGFTQYYDALKSNNPWWQLLGGAAGTTLINTLTSTNNFFHAMASMLSNRNEDKAFPMKLDDFIDIFKEISSVNQTWKLIAAINTGKWMSKNESYIGDVTKANAFFMAMTGLSPQQQDDAYIKSSIKQSELEMQKYVMKNAVIEYRRGLQAAIDKDPEYHRYFRRAFTMLEIGGFPTDKKAAFIATANKGYENRIDAQDYALAFKNVPTSKSDFLGIPTPFTTQSNVEDTRRQQWIRTQQINDYKAQ